MQRFRVNFWNGCDSFSKTVLAKNEIKAIFRLKSELKEKDDERANWHMEAIALGSR